MGQDASQDREEGNRAGMRAARQEMESRALATVLISLRKSIENIKCSSHLMYIYIYIYINTIWEVRFGPD